MEYKHTRLYYNNTVQVRYYDWEYRRYMAGIAYHDILIRACDGEVLLIQDLEVMPGFDEDSIIEMSWIDLNEKILKG